LAKSFAGYGPIGPWLTTADEMPNLDKQTVTTMVNGQLMQESTLGHLIFSPAALVAYLSSIVALYPGDLIFTGTPSGTGVGHDPQIFLQAGDKIVSAITGLGSLHITMR
jgi:2-keto-4-pentenoate hydratase/2-oxohepta-3-ene-1,7-dioic acid hydratase in catechol pathway